MIAFPTILINLRWYMLSVMIAVAGCRCRCWGTAIVYSSNLMRGRKIGLRAPEIKPGTRTFET